MFFYCGYERGVFQIPEKSRWCSVFDKQGFDFANYLSDLNIYYLYGPGNKINSDMSCNLVKDIVNSLKAKAGIATGYRKYKLILRAGHIEMLLPLYGKLGLFLDDTDLKADNFDQMQNRKFVSGKLGPMAGNIAFVLYKCSYGEYKIQMYVNERLIKMSACVSKVECPLKKFLDYYQGIVDQCDYNSICN